MSSPFAQPDVEERAVAVDRVGDRLATGSPFLGRAAEAGLAFGGRRAQVGALEQLVVLGVQCLGVDRLIGTGCGLDDLGEFRCAGSSETVGDVVGLADLERNVRVRPISPVPRTLAPREDVRAAPSERMERLAAEARRFERNPQRGVEQVVLAGQDHPARELEAAVAGTHHGAEAVGKEGHEGEAGHLGGRRLVFDQLEVHG